MTERSAADLRRLAATDFLRLAATDFRRLAALLVAYDDPAEVRACTASLAGVLDARSIFVFDNSPTSDGGNIGYCAAMNRLIATAREAGFAYGLAINPDARIDAGSLGVLVAALERDPQIAIAHPKVFRRHQASVLDGSWLELTWRHLATRFAGEGAPDGARWSVPRRVLAGHGCCALVRLDAVSREGGYDEAFFAYQDEVDLGLRLARAGLSVLYEPRAAATHAGPTFDARREALKAYFLARNSVLLYRKHARGWDRAKFFFWMVMGGIYHGARALGGDTRSRRICEGWRDGFASRRRYPQETAP
ncbi:MAG: glycosyltransferase family 2 protein [Deltaproteobacteria bacterium]|nr:glycosyltransferase family 2 protein [Deltaproteobacteria bacterium]